MFHFCVDRFRAQLLAEYEKRIRNSRQTYAAKLPFRFNVRLIYYKLIVYHAIEYHKLFGILPK